MDILKLFTEYHSGWILRTWRETFGKSRGSRLGRQDAVK